MAETIRFETNIPQEMAFTYAAGKEVEGRYGAQFLRGTTDGRVVYLPPIVETKLLNLGVGPGELVEVCKREQKVGQKRNIVWEVKRVDAAGDPSQATGNGATPTKNSPSPAATESSAPKSSAVQAQPTMPEYQPGQTQFSRILAACAIAAIDAAITAEQYAASKNFPLKFREDQVQALTSTLYIQHSKQSNIALMHDNQAKRANGGADPWRH